MAPAQYKWSQTWPNKYILTQDHLETQETLKDCKTLTPWKGMEEKFSKTNGRKGGRKKKTRQNGVRGKE